MTIRGRVQFNGPGIETSIGAMVMFRDMASIFKDNVSCFNQVGYRKKIPVLSSFAEYLGPHALSVNRDESPGRIKRTKYPLDLAIAGEGYFQVQTKNGVKLTKDGRFRVDKEGNLLTIENFKVLSANGMPIKLEKVPENLEDIKIDTSGRIKYKDPDGIKLLDGDTISVVTTDGTRVENANVKQGYIELSNVALHEEVYNILPLKKSFGVNIELFKIQNESLTKTIQELGKA